MLGEDLDGLQCNFAVELQAKAEAELIVIL